MQIIPFFLYALSIASNSFIDRPNSLQSNIIPPAPPGYSSLTNFQKLNKELLGDDALPETIDDSERKKSGNNVENFDLEYQRQLGEISALTTIMFEEKTAKRAKYGDQEDILFEDIKPTKITEETRQHVLDHPELYASCPARIRNGQFYTDEEYEQHVEESLNRPLPGEEKGIQFTKKNKK